MTPASAADDRALLAELSLSRAAVDRAAELRDDDSWWATAQASGAAGVLLLAGTGAPHVPGPDGPRLLLVPADTDGLEDFGDPVLLGVDDGRPLLARWVRSSQAEAAAELVERFGAAAGASPQWRDLRQTGADLDAADAGLLTTSVALLGWHSRHGHCPRCGSGTTSTSAGWSRRCDACGSVHFPRTDPAVIVLVLSPDGQRALLGRRSEWPEQWYSTLAGFVESGESAELAVVREVAEEAGVEVDPASLAYLGSQPWPFPASLMLGYHATAVADVEPTPDGTELADVRWVSREQIRAGGLSGDLRVPPRVSIARRLIERWYGEELPGEWSRG